MMFPSTAALLQHKLGLRGCAAMDVQAVCTGFIYALAVADKFIASGQSKCALVVGAEVFSRLLDWSDRRTCVLFGDGRSEEHTSELQSLMRISYAVFCLNKKKQITTSAKDEQRDY